VILKIAAFDLLFDRRLDGGFEHGSGARCHSVCFVCTSRQ
jgi:hypothetical protein